MKPQELTESLKVGLNEQSTLSSQLIDTTMLIEESKKEIEVTCRCEGIKSYLDLVCTLLFLIFKPGACLVT